MKYFIILIIFLLCGCLAPPQESKYDNIIKINAHSDYKVIYIDYLTEEKEFKKIVLRGFDGCDIKIYCDVKGEDSIWGSTIKKENGRFLHEIHLHNINEINIIN